MEYARRTGARKLGIAVCSGLLGEGRTLARILRANGFDVYGMACKVGSLTRAELGVADSCCDYGAVSCDPLLQARLLNEAGTDLNIVMGLCVGHDTLFYRHSHAPTTTLVTKDHVTGHNACAGLYASKSVYRRRLNETVDACREGVIAQV